jgi:hypothetical protein
MAWRPTRPMILGMTPMNSPTANDQFGFSLGNLSYIDSHMTASQFPRPSGRGSTGLLAGSAACGPMSPNGSVGVPSYRRWR